VSDTAAPVQRGPVRPWWLERQRRGAEDESPDGDEVPANSSFRNWTLIGNVDSSLRASVDPRGLVTPWPPGWSVDWWIGADDRWHFPSEEPSVRQQLVDGSPVVETRMRVPGGDAVHRAYGARGAASDVDVAVIEVENASSLPFALALAVRPYDVRGAAHVERIEVVDDLLVVDGNVGARLPARPSRVAVTAGDEGDCARLVVAGDALEDGPRSVRCRDGRAQVALLFPLAHRATVRVVLPLVVPKRRTDPPPEPDRVPPAANVARGWAAQTDRGMRVEVPDERLSTAIEAARRQLLLYSPGRLDPVRRPWPRPARDAGALVSALTQWGFTAEASELAEGLGQIQGMGGRVVGLDAGIDATGAVLAGLGELWRATHDLELFGSLAMPMARAGHWIERARFSRRHRKDPLRRGLLPTGRPPAHLGPPGQYYWDDWWSIRGLLDAAEVLEGVGQVAAAVDATRFARSLRSDLERSIELVGQAGHEGGPEEPEGPDRPPAALPPGPDRGTDAGAVGSLVACAPLGLLGPHDPAVTATLELVRREHTHGAAVGAGMLHRGLSPALTALVAMVEVDRGEPEEAWARVSWLLDAATPTWTWPDVVHPRRGGGVAGDGHSLAGTTGFLGLVRRMLVRDVATLDVDGGSRAGLALCSVVPAGWLGQSLEVHDAPTAAGSLSFGVRWHGDRPALLWELVPHVDQGAVTITAPGLDPDWSTSERKGEALLAPAAGER